MDGLNNILDHGLSDPVDRRHIIHLDLPVCQAGGMITGEHVVQHLQARQGAVVGWCPVAVTSQWSSWPGTAAAV